MRTRRSLTLSTPRGHVRKERPDGSPLKVREFVSHDSRPRFGSLNHAYLGVRNAELQVRDEPDSGHAADTSKTTRMTRSRRGALKIFAVNLSPVVSDQFAVGLPLRLRTLAATLVQIGVRAGGRLTAPPWRLQCE
jgi:hypothetical protein